MQKNHILYTEKGQNLFKKGQNCCMIAVKRQERQVCMEKVNTKGIAGGIPVYCAHDEIVDINALIENPRNPNTHPQKQITILGHVIKNQGWRAPITVSKRSGFIVKGHGRLQAARQAGFTEIPVDYQDYKDEAAEWADLIADNRIAELSTPDNEIMAELLEEMQDMDIDMALTGYEEDEIEALLKELEEETEEVVEDDYNAPPPEEPKAKRGDIYKLGNHRLMCGDSTSLADVEKLMAEENKCRLLLTDPPYGIKADKGFSGSCGFSGTGKPIPRRQYEDDWDGFTPEKECFDLITNKAEESIIFGGNFFTDKLPVGNHWLVWNKHNTMPTFSDAELAYTNIKRNSVKIYDIAYNGLIGKEKERVHPTQKPVQLMADIIKDYTKEGETILDCFGGSGTTLIACEQLGRTCYMMEYEPKYIDVIIDRWEKFTGEKAVLLKK